MAGKKDIVEHVFRETGLSKQKAAEAVDAVFQAITEALASGERVAVSGFGSFVVRERKARQGRNPATGETIRIPAARNVGFKPSKALSALAGDPTIDYPDEDEGSGQSGEK